MLFRVVRTDQRGIPLSRKALLSTPGVIGDLVTWESVDEPFKGSIVVARLHKDSGGHPVVELIPRLYAPMLRGFAPNGMMLTGHERVEERDGIAHYVQGWWARLP